MKVLVSGLENPCAIVQAGCCVLSRAHSMPQEKTWGADEEEEC